MNTCSLTFEEGPKKGETEIFKGTWTWDEEMNKWYFSLEKPLRLYNEEEEEEEEDPQCFPIEEEDFDCSDDGELFGWFSKQEGIYLSDEDYEKHYKNAVTVKPAKKQK